MQDTAHPDSGAAGGYAPFAQLIKMLLPSAGSVAIYDPQGELKWCSDGFARPELRDLLEQRRSDETLSNRGRVETTSSGIPVFIAMLRGPDAMPLGAIVVELGASSSRSTPSMIVSMLRPVLDCLEGRLAFESAAFAGERSAGLDLLLRADDDGGGANALEDLVRHCARELRCVTGALLVPDKNIELSWSGDDSAAQTRLLDRTQKHLLAWARLNNRPLVVNRAAKAGAYKILSCPLRDPNGGVLGLIALFRAVEADDFEQRDVRILEFVSRKAVAILCNEYDPLTGLPSRMIFERRAQRALDAAPAAVLYVDIDELGVINEAFGLSAGDEVIQRVGGLTQQAVGPDALTSRIAGDRFAVVLPEGTLARAGEAAARILAAVSQLRYLNGSETLAVSVSIGAVAGAAKDRLAHLLAAAELACKRAKAKGGSRVAAVEESSAVSPAAAREAVAAAELRAALVSNQFQLDAQPIVGLRGALAPIAGYELLVRLRNAAGEISAPDKFLAACAEYGLLPALDRWVLHAAVEALRPHADALAEASLFFALNVSGQSLESRKYAAFALETLAAAGLPPCLFCFEIKEPDAVAHLAAADALIRDLTCAGAKVALDHFGSGLSSLAHLKQLPVSFIKIDGEFVRRMAVDRIAESIVSGIARAAETLGVPTIAEHVETPAAAERVRQLGVTLGQGFHLGRPQPLAAAVTEAVPALPAARVTAGT